MAAVVRPHYIGGDAVFRPQYDTAAAADLQASVSAQASISASLTTAIRLQASPAAVASITATLSSDGLAATVSAAAGITASLTTAIRMQAALAARASITADLNAVSSGASAAAVWGYVMSNGQTAEQNLLALLDGCMLLKKIMVNKQVTSPTAGTFTIFDDDNVTPLLRADLFEDEAGTQAYRDQGADRREKLA
jgi:hypothetical protein